jgi:hypothetical protein
MTTSTALPADLQYSHALRLAIAAYLARFKATSRTHAESDLRAYLARIFRVSFDEVRVDGAVVV